MTRDLGDHGDWARGNRATPPHFIPEKYRLTRFIPGDTPATTSPASGIFHLNPNIVRRLPCGS